MKLHPTKLSDNSQTRLESIVDIQSQLQVLFFVTKQLVDDALKDREKWYMKLATLGESTWEIFRTREPEWEGFEYIWREIGKLRYDILFEVLDTLKFQDCLQLTQLKTIVKSMFLLSKKYMEKEFEIFPSQI